MSRVKTFPVRIPTMFEYYSASSGLGRYTHYTYSEVHLENVASSLLSLMVDVRGDCVETMLTARPRTTRCSHLLLKGYVRGMARCPQLTEGAALCLPLCGPCEHRAVSIKGKGRKTCGEWAHGRVAVKILACHHCSKRHWGQ